MELLDRLQSRFPEHYRHGNILMIHGDCMDVMKHIHDKEVELSCVDPPYGIGEDGERSNRPRKTDKWKCPKSKNIVIKDWDNKKPTKEYFDELFRVSKNQIIWGGNYFGLPASSCWIFWDKKNGDNDFSDGELAWGSFSSAVRKFEYLWNGFQKQKPEERFHPTQKPVALYKWLLYRYAKPAELILDTHGGSGSIVIACHDLGHPIIWVEKDADYYRDAVARYKTHASQAVLFEPVEIMKEQKLFEV
jgi:site-specific DNA-methyltransferase (adenine-specific)